MVHTSLFHLHCCSHLSILSICSHLSVRGLTQLVLTFNQRSMFSRLFDTYLVTFSPCRRTDPDDSAGLFRVLRSEEQLLVSHESSSLLKVRIPSFSCSLIFLFPHSLVPSFSCSLILLFPYSDNLCGYHTVTHNGRSTHSYTHDWHTFQSVLPVGGRITT